MFIQAIDATGAIQPTHPWAFYECLPVNDPRYTTQLALVLTNPCLFPSNTAQFSYKPENIIRGPLSLTMFRGPGNISAFTDEPLDWETGIEVAPPRHSGTIQVAHYAGRGVQATEDY